LTFDKNFAIMPNQCGEAYKARLIPDRPGDHFPRRGINLGFQLYECNEEALSTFLIIILGSGPYNL